MVRHASGRSLRRRPELTSDDTHPGYDGGEVPGEGAAQGRNAAIGRRKAGQPTDAAGAPNHRLRAARAERHWTQLDVARALGVSNLTISRWELGTQQPVPFFREKLCALFGQSARELGLLSE